MRAGLGSRKFSRLGQALRPIDDLLGGAHGASIETYETRGESVDERRGSVVAGADP
jgi:hypothetical protein